MKQKFVSACERLNRIEFDKISMTNRKSDMNLVIEYARRVAVLKNDYPNLQITHPLFFKAETVFGVEISQDMLVVCPVLKEVKNSYIKGVCLEYLKFVYLIDEAHPIATEHKDLYEPLIKLYERNGLFGLHNGEVVAGGCGWGPGKQEYMMMLEPIEISDIALDEYDRK